MAENSFAVMGGGVWPRCPHLPAVMRQTATGSPWAWFPHWQMAASHPPSHRMFWEAEQIEGAVLIKSNDIITRKAVTEPSAGSQTVNGIWIELALVLKVSEHFYHHKVIYKHQKWIRLFQSGKPASTEISSLLLVHCCVLSTYHHVSHIIGPQ